MNKIKMKKKFCSFLFCGVLLGNSVSMNVAAVDGISSMMAVGDFNEAVLQMDTMVSERENSGKEKRGESDFELTDYSNLVREHIPEAMGRCRTSFLGKRANGGYQVALYTQGKIYIRNFSSSYQVESSKAIDLELPIWGGIFLGESYNYVICGEKYDKQKEKGGEVYQIIKYSKDFERIDSVSLNGEETYTALPFDGGNVSVDESGNLLTIYTSRLRYDGHQSNIAIHINTSDMTIVDMDGMAHFPEIHVSHSFRQIVKYDNKEPVYVDLSDGSPQRSVFLQFQDIKKGLIEIAGEYGDNVTNAELSGLAISDTNYLVVGSYMNQNANNIFLSSIDKNSGEVENQWLTDSSSFVQKYFHNPTIVKIGKDKFAVMWGSYSTQYILVDGKGNIISELKECSAPITDCESIYDKGRILCLSIENGLMTLYEITDFASNGIYKPEIGTVSDALSWDGTIDVSWYDEKKTEFNIFTAQQLAGFAQIVNEGNTFQGKKINLCQEIFLNDESYKYVWTPIAAYAGNDASDLNVFQGTFCGNGHAIYNMRTSANNHGGLFGHIGENGLVKCVDISQGLLYSGGCIANVNEGIISFCNNYSCTGGDLDFVGGICNVNSNLVYGCKNFGEVWGSMVAGIVGLNKKRISVVSQCSNHGLVGGSSSAAGIVFGNYGWLYNCYNKGIIADGYLGNLNRARCLCGIVYGNYDYATVVNCYSAGVFSYQKDTTWMGVYGIYRENQGREITNCYALSASGQNNVGVETVSYEELVNPSFIQKLDQQNYSAFSVWREDASKRNDGMPITAADEGFFTGKCKIQPEIWITGGKKVREVNLKDNKYQLEFSCYYNEAEPIVTIEDTDIAEISEDNIILFKKAETTFVNIHFNETENNSSADCQFILKIIDNTENIAQAEVTLSQNEYIYDGVAKTPAVTVNLNGKTLKCNTDYMVVYSNNVNIGTAEVTIIGKGNYTGSASVNFTIVKAVETPDTGNNTNINLSDAADKVENTNTIKQYAIKQYTITFKTNTKPAVLTQKITAGKKVTIPKQLKTLKRKDYIFDGWYNGKNRYDFFQEVKSNIILQAKWKKVTVKKSTISMLNHTKSKKLSIKIKKISGAKGYEVSYATNKKFKSAKKKTTNKTTITLKNLKKGRTYYVRVHAYKLDSANKKVYGKWSKIKKIKIERK